MSITWQLCAQILRSEVKGVVHLEIVKVTAEIKALPSSISHCPVSVDPAQQCSQVVNCDQISPDRGCREDA